jgi:hypothetical protein
MSPRSSIPVLLILAGLSLTGCAERADSASAAMAAADGYYPNPVTGEAIPDPNPVRIGGWAELPEGREWGSTAGIDIDPTDGHVWAYERCGSGSAGGPGVNCDNNLVDPIFKFDRHTGAGTGELRRGRLRHPPRHRGGRRRQRLGNGLRR